MDPKMPIISAPIATRTVPTKEYRVKGSLRTRDAHIELKTRPDYSGQKGKLVEVVHIQPAA